MTFEEVYAAKAWDAAIAAERDRCIAIVRANRGKCVSDDACEALVEELRHATLGRDAMTTYTTGETMQVFRCAECKAKDAEIARLTAERNAALAKVRELEWQYCSARARIAELET